MTKEVHVMNESEPRIIVVDAKASVHFIKRRHTSAQ